VIDNPTNTLDHVQHEIADEIHLTPHEERLAAALSNGDTKLYGLAITQIKEEKRKLLQEAAAKAAAEAPPETEKVYPDTFYGRACKKTDERVAAIQAKLDAAKAG
jgi:hypothetical protein